MANSTGRLYVGRLYVSGHAKNRGYAIELQFSDAECLSAPDGELEKYLGVRKWVTSRDAAFRLVSRWNRRFASH